MYLEDTSANTAKRRNGNRIDTIACNTNRPKEMPVKLNSETRAYAQTLARLLASQLERAIIIPCINGSRAAMIAACPNTTNRRKLIVRVQRTEMCSCNDREQCVGNIILYRHIQLVRINYISRVYTVRGFSYG